MKRLPFKTINAALLVIFMGIVAFSLFQPYFGCRQTGPSGPVNRNLRAVELIIGGKPFILEVADQEETRRIGLMNRPSMPDNRGMIFVFNHEQSLYFWMKNTLIPLDILYLDRGGRIVSMHQMQPHDTREVESSAPAMYAIELNVGTAEKLGLREGDVVAIPADLKAGD